MSITKTFKGYACEISNSPIFWTINSIDKPSQQYLNDNIKWTKVNFTPNFIDQFTVNIVVDSDQYTLLKIYEIYDKVDSDKPDKVETTQENQKIFINANVSKILKKGYLLTFDLDIWATYIFKVFESNYPNDNSQNFQLTQLMHVNRAYSKNILETGYADDFIYKNDPLLNFNDCGYSPIYETIREIESENGAVNLATELGRAGYISTDYMKKVTFYNASPMYYGKIRAYVYQLPATGSYLMVYDFRTPYISLKVSGAFNQGVTDPLEATIYNGRNLHAWLQGSQNSGAQWIYKNFIGVYNVPFFQFLPYIDWWNGEYFIDGDPTKKAYIKDVNGLNRTFFTSIIEPNSYIKLNKNKVTSTIKYPNNFDPQTATSYNSVWRFNSIAFRQSINFPTYYLLTKLEYENWKVGMLNPWTSWLNGGYITFNGDTFNFYFNNNNGDSTTNNWDKATYKYIDLKSWYSTINIATDSYINYINSVKSTQNTNLQIAKQQSALGIASAVFGGIGSIASSVATGGAAGAVSAGGSLISTGMGIANNILKYQNTKKQIDAQNADAKRSSSANNVNSNAVVDDMNNKIYSAGGSANNITNGFNVKWPTPQQCVQFNKIIGDYGFYIDLDMDIDTINVIFLTPEYNGNTYTILDVEPDEFYIRQKLPNIDNATVEAIKTIFNNSFRIWTVDPTGWGDTSQQYSIRGWSAE